MAFDNIALVVARNTRGIAVLRLPTAKRIDIRIYDGYMTNDIDGLAFE